MFGLLSVFGFLSGGINKTIVIVTAATIAVGGLYFAGYRSGSNAQKVACDMRVNEVAERYLKVQRQQVAEQQKQQDQLNKDLDALNEEALKDEKTKTFLRELVDVYEEEEVAKIPVPSCKLTKDDIKNLE